MSFLSILPAFPGASPANTATPTHGLSADFTTQNPPGRHGLMADFGGRYHLAGTPTTEPRISARPLVLGVLQQSRFDFDVGRYLAYGRAFCAWVANVVGRGRLDAQAEWLKGRRIVIEARGVVGQFDQIAVGIEDGLAAAPGEDEQVGEIVGCCCWHQFDSL